MKTKEDIPVQLGDVNIIHLSNCLCAHCPNLDKIRSTIESYGIRCEQGTH